MQQTQVSTVIPYFERWMRRFPDIDTLAAAPLDDVLALWAGLGYYARARNLHRTARVCAEQHGASLPVSPDGLRALPGIGDSTANAIISQATDQPAAVLDGNVRRVLARHATIPGWTGSAATQKKLWREAEARLPDNRGADYTQAIMDLGALVCTRSKPDCGACPLHSDCRAFQADRVEEYPAPKPRTKVSERRFVVAVVRNARGEVLLERRPPAGIWGGLWSLPEADNREALAEGLGVDCGNARHLPEVEHRLSHRLLRIQPLMLDHLAPTHFPGGINESAERGWFMPGAADFPGVPKPIGTLLDQLPEH